MSDHLKIAIVQLNPTLGAIEANLSTILEAKERGAGLGLDLVVFQELCLTGYPPEDLVLKPAFQAEAAAATQRLAEATAGGGPALLVGAPRLVGGKLYNASFLLGGGKVLAVRDKVELPNYGVFDEKRVFDPGALPEVVEFKGWKLGMLTCEDLWYPGISGHLKAAGAEILIAPHGSPFERGKIEERFEIAEARVEETGLPVIFVNQVGGQDELVFDGTSFVMDGDGEVRVRLTSFREDWAEFKIERDDGRIRITGGRISPRLGSEAEVYTALMIGLRDYVEKNHFPGVIIGLSGGIDSALTAALAVDALGPQRVRTVMMPSPFTSGESLTDAEACAASLGAGYEIIPITEAMEAYGEALKEAFQDQGADTTEENIQARIRGNILMALSNKFGSMVVATGNKSEFSVGYSTLYGDLCGGFAVLKDLYKTGVYGISRWRNEHKPDGGLGPEGQVIPENIFTKAPSAELKPDQRDDDTLPPYDQLDQILDLLVEGDASIDDVVAEGFERQTVARIEHMIYIAEYKRRQAPPGVKITRRQFGRDRRYPITNSFRNAKRWEDEEA